MVPLCNAPARSIVQPLIDDGQEFQAINATAGASPPSVRLVVVILGLFLAAGCTAVGRDTSSGATSISGVGTLPVGAALPSGTECAARIQRDPQEPRPENTPANHVVPDRVSMPVWKDFTAQANREFVPRIDGDFTGTTGEILAWGACKWGLDADLVRAVAAQESKWRQSTVSDESRRGRDCVGGARPPCPTSFGIMQLKHIFLPGSYPLSQRSTAFNVDYYGARIRSCYEGWVTYLHGDYGPGDIWHCVGWHWSGDWKDPGAERYIQRVRGQLERKPWLDWADQPG